MFWWFMRAAKRASAKNMDSELSLSRSSSRLTFSTTSLLKPPRPEENATNTRAMPPCPSSSSRR